MIRQQTPGVLTARWVALTARGEMGSPRGTCARPVVNINTGLELRKITPWRTISYKRGPTYVSIWKAWSPGFPPSAPYLIFKRSLSVRMLSKVALWALLYPISVLSQKVVLTNDDGWVGIIDIFISGGIRDIWFATEQGGPQLLSVPSTMPWKTRTMTWVHTIPVDCTRTYDFDILVGDFIVSRWEWLRNGISEYNALHPVVTMRIQFVSDWVSCRRVQREWPYVSPIFSPWRYWKNNNALIRPARLNYVNAFPSVLLRTFSTRILNFFAFIQRWFRALWNSNPCSEILRRRETWFRRQWTKCRKWVEQTLACYAFVDHSLGR